VLGWLTFAVAKLPHPGFFRRRRTKAPGGLSCDSEGLTDLFDKPYKKNSEKIKYSLAAAPDGGKNTRRPVLPYGFEPESKEWLMGMIDELEKLGEVEVLRGMANGKHGQPGSPLRSQVEAWLHLKEFERTQTSSTQTSKATAGTLDVTKEKPLVFISYDTDDIEIAYHFESILKRVFHEGIRTFIAHRDIKAGQAAFQRMLQDSLAQSRLVLALCTKRSLTSPWLWFESGAGFGRGDLIPMLWGVTPEQIKPPMNIFQGKRLDNKPHVEQLVARISEITGVEADTTVTDSEFSELTEICCRIDAEIKKFESTRIEDTVNFPMPGPPHETPIQYLIEASFPLAKDIPRLRLLKAIAKCKITIPSTQARFSYTFPDTELKPEVNGNDAVLSINCYTTNPATNITDQQALVISDAIVFTYWHRQFQIGSKLVVVDGNEVNRAAVIAFTFFNKIGKELGISRFKMRVRIFDLQDAQLNPGQFFERDITKFRAPSTNNVEVSREITATTDYQDFIDLMMHVWEKFQGPNGKMPALSELRYKGTLKILAEGKEE
jgi:hypothetical protein